MKSNQIPQYDIITEEGIKIEDPEESKEHIASYYENLYQAREPTEEQIETTRKIKEQVEKWSSDVEHNAQQEPITTDEMNKAMRRLERGKSSGPDDIPNEALI